MTTRNLVPRADGEGSIGTAAKQWGAMRAKNIYIDGVDITEQVTETADKADDAAASATAAAASVTQAETIKSNMITEAEAIKDAMLAGYGYPFTASTAADMTDATKIYVYVGSETGYNNGHWYYHNGTAWTDGGVYNSTAFETDETLTVSGAAADALVTGKCIRSIYNGKEQILFTETPGYISQDGEISAPSSSKDVYTNKIAVSEGDVFDLSLVYSNSHSMWLVVARYDSTDAFINCSNIVNNVTQTSYSGQYTVPADTGYILFSYSTYDDATFTVTRDLPYVKTDTTLSVSGKPADAKVTGDMLKPLDSAFNQLTILSDPPRRLDIAFSNSYIDKRTGKLASFNKWNVYTVSLHQGERLQVDMGGNDSLIATCEDENPTAESTFNIIFTFYGRRYSLDYTAEDDMILYISSDSYNVNDAIISKQNIINVNTLNDKIEGVENKVNKVSMKAVQESNGYIDSLEKIESIEYNGNIENPWIKLEHEDDFEEFGTYIDNKIASIPKGNSFIWITDVHYSSNRKHSGKLVDYVRRRANIKTILHGGDVQNERPYAIDAAKYWLAFNRDYVGKIGTDFKQVCGDHDHNGQYWGNKNLRNQYGLTDPADTFFTCKFVQKVLTGYCENEIVYDTTYDKDIKEHAIDDYGWNADDIEEYNAFKKMYYYFDNESIKTRFIVLFTGWSWSSYGFPSNKIGNISPLYVQMEFFYKALMTVPDGFNVVVCGHNTVINPLVETVEGKSYYNTTKTVFNGSAFRHIYLMLGALLNKGLTAYQVSYCDWSTYNASVNDLMYKKYDFSDAPSVNLVTTIGGDVHWDILAKSPATSYDTINTIQSGDSINIKNEILHSVTMADGVDRGYRDYYTREPIERPATPGTVDEQAFDVVTINESGIYFTRIGSGSDRCVLFASTQ